MAPDPLSSIYSAGLACVRARASAVIRNLARRRASAPSIPERDAALLRGVEPAAEELMSELEAAVDRTIEAHGRLGVERAEHVAERLRTELISPAIHQLPWGIEGSGRDIAVVLQAQEAFRIAIQIRTRRLEATLVGRVQAALLNPPRPAILVASVPRRSRIRNVCANERNDMDPLTKKQADRFRFLKALYDSTDGRTDCSVMMWDLGEEIGMSENAVEAAYQFLRDEGLVAPMGTGPVSITHDGVREVEDALSHPEERTHYFPPAINILSIGAINGSPLIQQGTNASNQNQSIGNAQLDDLRPVLDKLSQRIGELDLDPDTEAEARSDIVTVQAQLDSPKPKAAIVVEGLRSLRTILEGAASTVLVSEVLPVLVVAIERLRS